MNPTPRHNALWLWLNGLLAVAILVPALYGFGTKFRELVLLYGGYERTLGANRPHLSSEKQAELQELQAHQGLTDEATEGAFALVPILNYLLVTFGFLMLFGWAVMRGTFRDIERPKYNMLENETILDALAAGGRPAVRPDA
ncbi:MAG: hypothetical protein U0746_03350 [Gemmataceae bacterium]